MITCMAIDDEPLALKQIVKYIQKTPFLELKAGFESPLEAISYLQDNQIDLIFVDINMPDLNGLDFVRALENPPGIVFTTAYSEYAVEGFRVDAIDYLLKPIDYPTFLKAANKSRTRIQGDHQEFGQVKGQDDFLFIKSEYKIIRIRLEDITYIEGMREYVRIHLKGDKPLMTLLSMKSLETQLPGSSFMRVHRSYIVNLNQITTIERNRILFDDKVYIPVSDQYKDRFQSFIDNKFLK